MEIIDADVVNLDSPIREKAERIRIARNKAYADYDRDPAAYEARSARDFAAEDDKRMIRGGLIALAVGLLIVACMALAFLNSWNVI